jgi:hypothetical protein
VEILFIARMTFTRRRDVLAIDPWMLLTSQKGDIVVGSSGRQRIGGRIDDVDPDC